MLTTLLLRGLVAPDPAPGDALGHPCITLVQRTRSGPITDGDNAPQLKSHLKQALATPAERNIDDPELVAEAEQAMADADTEAFWAGRQATLVMVLSGTGRRHLWVNQPVEADQVAIGRGPAIRLLQPLVSDRSGTWTVVTASLDAVACWRWTPEALVPVEAHELPEDIQFLAGITLILGHTGERQPGLTDGGRGVGDIDPHQARGDSHREQKRTLQVEFAHDIARGIDHLTRLGDGAAGVVLVADPHLGGEIVKAAHKPPSYPPAASTARPTRTPAACIAAWPKAWRCWSGPGMGAMPTIRLPASRQGRGPGWIRRPRPWSGS